MTFAKDWVNKNKLTVDRDVSQDRFTDSMSAASTFNTNDAAEAIGLAGQYGVPTPVAINQIDSLRKKKFEDQYANLPKTHPKSAEFLSEPFQAAASRDELDQVKKAEDVIGDLGWGDTIGRSLTGFALGTIETAVRSPALLYKAMQTSPLAIPAKLAGLPNDPPEWMYDNAITKDLAAVRKDLVPAAGLEDIKAAYASGDGSKMGKILTSAVAQNLPQVLFTAINPAMGLTWMFGQSSVDKFADNMKAGIDSDTAASNAVISGGIEVATERMFGIGTKGFKSMIAETVKHFGEEGAVKAIKESLKQIGKSFAEEGAEEFIASIAQGLVDFGQGIQKDYKGTQEFSEAVYSFLVGGLAGGGTTTTMIGLNKALAKRSEQNKVISAKEAVEKLAELKKESKRPDEQFAKQVGVQTQGTNLAEATIETEKIEVLYQSKDVNVVEVMTKIGAIEKWKQAKESGMALELTAEQLAMMPLFENLGSDLKFKNQEFSYNELKEQHETRQAEEKAMFAEMDKMLAEANKEFTPEELQKMTEDYNNESLVKPEKIKAIRRTVEQDVSGQLVAAGYSKESAQKNAMLAGRFFSTLEERHGLDAMDMYKKYRATIVRDSYKQMKRVQQQKVLATRAEIKLNEQADKKGLLDPIMKALKITKKKTPEQQAEIDKISKQLEAEAEAKFKEEISKMPVVKRDRWGKIIPQVSVLMQIKNDLSEGREWTKGVLINKDAKTNDVTRAGGTSTAKEYIQANKYNSYEYMESRTDNIISKVERSKKLNKNDYQFLERFYEGAVDVINNNFQHSAMEEAAIPTDDFIPFQESDGLKKGAYIPAKLEIKLFEAKDLSTYLHESGHWYLDIMEKIASTQGAPESLQKEFFEICKYVGAKQGKLNREQHEKFADAFENYLASGRAPSKGLKAAFHSFMNWMMQVYKGIRMQPGLSPEIIGVFDRMLATDEEIKQQNDIMELGTDEIDLAMKSGLDTETAFKLAEKEKDATDFAKDILIEKQIKTINRAKEKEYQEYRELVKEKFEKEADEIKAFDVIWAIKNDEYIEKLSKEEITEVGLEAEFPTELMKNKGSGLEQVAATYGYDGTLQMLNDIIEHPDRHEWVQTQINNYMMENFKELNPTYELSEQAEAALLNDKQLELKILKMKFLMEQEAGTVKGTAKKLISPLPTPAEIKQHATNSLSAVNIRNLKPYIFKRSMVQYQRESAKHFTKGDFLKAIEAQRYAAVSQEMYKQATEFLESFRKTKKDWKKFNKKNDDLSKTRDMTFINAARALIEMHTKGSEEKIEKYLGPIKAYDEESYKVISNLLADVTDDKNINDMSVVEFLSLEMAIDNLWEMAGDNKTFMKDGQKIELDELAKKVVDTFKKIGTPKYKGPNKPPETWKDKAKAGILSHGARFTRMEQWALGVNREMADLMFGTLSDPSTKYHLKKKEVVEKFKQIVDEHKDIFSDRKVVYEDFDKEMPFSMQTIAMMWLHSGNESNLKKLLLGYGWAEMKDGKLDTSRWEDFKTTMYKEGVITESTAKFGQKVWDLMESLKKDTQKAHKEIYGYYYNEITASPVYTPWGTFKGGYIPAKLDSVQAQNVKDYKLDITDAFSFVEPSVGRGATISRNESIQLPLDLQVNNLFEHIDWAMKFSYLSPPIKQLWKLLKRPDVKAAIGEYDEHAYDQIIRPFLDRAATQKTVTSSGDKNLDAAANWLKNTQSALIMFGNLKNTAEQFTGIVVAADEIGTYAFSGAAEYSRSPKTVAKFAYESSDYMKMLKENKIFELTQAIKDTIEPKTKWEKARYWSLKNTYILQAATQGMVDDAVWIGGYNKAIAEKMEHDQAVKYADSVVRTTQGSMLPVNVSHGETGTPTYRAVLHFQSYMNTIYNRLKMRWAKGNNDDDEGLKKLAASIVGIVLLPNFLVYLIGMVRDGKMFKDDQEASAGNFMANYLSQTARMGMGLIPLYGQLGQLTLSGLTKTKTDDRWSNPALSFVEGSIKTVRDVVEDTAEGKPIGPYTVDGIIQLVTAGMGVPVAGIVRKPLVYVMKVDEGLADPANPADFIRGLVTGK